MSVKRFLNNIFKSKSKSMNDLSSNDNSNGALELLATNEEAAIMNLLLDVSVQQQIILNKLAGLEARQTGQTLDTVLKDYNIDKVEARAYLISYLNARYGKFPSLEGIDL